MEKSSLLFANIASLLIGRSDDATCFFCYFLCCSRVEPHYSLTVPAYCRHHSIKEPQCRCDVDDLSTSSVDIAHQCCVRIVAIVAVAAVAARVSSLLFRA